jgi:hypothetical protein
MEIPPAHQYVQPAAHHFGGDYGVALLTWNPFVKLT